MGRHDVHSTQNGDSLRSFTRSVLEDVEALERILSEGKIEEGVRRIGAEQEMFLVDKRMRPACIAPSLISEIGDERLTTELAQFNLEANLSPQPFYGQGLRAMEAELTSLLEKVEASANRQEASVLLTGILPTLRKSDLTLENMTPSPRYRELNDAIVALRGGQDFQVRIQGLEELRTSHDNVMLEACNTSFQLHLQVGASEFAAQHNLAQLVSSPVLAVAVNSPLLLKHRLWHESRIALFEGSVDTRSSARQERGIRPRVHFGDRWVDDSILEIFQDDISRFRVMIASELESSSLSQLEQGSLPKLAALCLHNGTVYRWNRPCYGVAGGIAHLRVENRTLPAGPSVVDEMANAAFYFGLMSGLEDEAASLAKRMNFDEVRTNFRLAAAEGLGASMRWLDGKRYKLTDLVLNELLPIASEGLQNASIDEADINRYLGVIRQRVETGRSGSRWMLDALGHIEQDGSLSTKKESRDTLLTRWIHDSQKTSLPVHEWPAHMLESHPMQDSMVRYAGQMMTEDLFTLRAEDVLDLAASIMKWKHIRHVPVEDDEGRLVGLVTHREWISALAGSEQSGAGAGIAIATIMRRDPLRVHPGTRIEDVRREMVTANSSCALVTEENGRLLGIITEHDLMGRDAEA